MVPAIPNLICPLCLYVFNYSWGNHWFWRYTNSCTLLANQDWTTSQKRFPIFLDCSGSNVWSQQSWSRWQQPLKYLETCDDPKNYRLLQSSCYLASQQFGLVKWCGTCGWMIWVIEYHWYFARICTHEHMASYHITVYHSMSACITSQDLVVSDGLSVVYGRSMFNNRGCLQVIMLENQHETLSRLSQWRWLPTMNQF